MWKKSERVCSWGATSLQFGMFTFELLGLSTLTKCCQKTNSSLLLCALEGLVLSRSVCAAQARLHTLKNVCLWGLFIVFIFRTFSGLNLKSEVFFLRILSPFLPARFPPTAALKVLYVKARFHFKKRSNVLKWTKSINRMWRNNWHYVQDSRCVEERWAEVK